MRVGDSFTSRARRSACEAGRVPRRRRTRHAAAAPAPGPPPRVRDRQGRRRQDDGLRRARGARRPPRAAHDRRRARAPRRRQPGRSARRRARHGGGDGTAARCSPRSSSRCPAAGAEGAARHLGRSRAGHGGVPDRPAPAAIARRACSPPSRTFGYLAAATPGLSELLAMGKVWELAQPTRRTPGSRAVRPRHRRRPRHRPRRRDAAGAAHVRRRGQRRPDRPAGPDDRRDDRRSGRAARSSP